MAKVKFLIISLDSKKGKSAQDHFITYLQRHSLILYLDIKKKAFDRVDRDIPLSKLWENGVRGKLLLHAIQCMLLSPSTTRVLHKGHLSKEYLVSNGTAQGKVVF